MNTLKAICRSIMRMVKQAWSLPQTVAYARMLRQQQMVLDEQEIERLDRIRNPSKYRGR